MSHFARPQERGVHVFHPKHRVSRGHPAKRANGMCEGSNIVSGFNCFQLLPSSSIGLTGLKPA